MILAIDFDGVLCDPDNVPAGKRMGEPVDGARDSMKRLYDDDHELIIHTVRASTPITDNYDEVLAKRVKHIEDWMDYYHIPYHEITAIKPNADAYLDNKGIHFTSWAQAMVDIHELITL